MRGTIFGAIGARLGTASAAGTFETNLKRGGVLAQNVEVAFVTTFTSSLWLAALAKLATSAFGETSISFWDLVDDLGGGRFPRLGPDPARDAAAVGGLVPARLGPGLGRHADGHGAGRHGDASAAVPRDLPDPQRHRERDRRGALHRRDRRSRSSGWRSATEPGVRRIVLEMTAVIALTPILDIAAGALLQAQGADARPAAGALHLDPAVRLAGGRAGRHPLLAAVLEAPARCDHAARPARAPRGGRRLDRGAARARDLHDDRGGRVRARRDGRASPGLAPPTRSAARCSRGSSCCR